MLFTSIDFSDYYHGRLDDWVILLYSMKIPMGYKVILAYERLDIVSSGNIVWKNQDKNAWERRTLDGWKIKYIKSLWI